MSTPAPLMPQATNIVPGVPTPGELTGWNNRRSAARQQYANSMAQNSLSRGQAGVARDSGLQAWQSGVDSQRAKLPESYAARGMARSGLYQRGLRDFYSAALADQNKIQNTYANALGGSNLGDANAANELAQLLGQIESEEQGRRSQLASEIRGVL